jgi:hypothetical protein
MLVTGKNMEMKNQKRRNFFQFIGLGAVVSTVASVNPIKAFSKSSKKKKSSFKVELHPNSVSRKSKA